MKDRLTEISVRLLRDAGVQQGMRVLDVGCATGSYTLLVSELVGAQGSVTGLDRNPGAIAHARERAENMGLGNVDFICGDLGEPLIGLEGFDAVVGRRILMHLGDPDAVLAVLVEAVRPGGIVVFEETDASMVPVSSVPLPLHDEVHRWIWETSRRGGANPRIGLALSGLLERAGFVVDGLRAEAVVQTSRHRQSLVPIVRAMLPLMENQGVVTADEVALDTLEMRLDHEIRETGATYIGHMVFGAWGRSPAETLNPA